MRLGLANRLAIIFSLLVLVATATVGYFVYRGARESLIVASTDRLADTAEIVAARFAAGIEDVGEDARIVAGTPPVKGLVRLRVLRSQGFQLDPETANSEDDWREQLEDVFTALLENRPSYVAIRLIALGGDGQELARAERRGEQVVWARSTQLQRLEPESLIINRERAPEDVLYLSEITIVPTDSADVPMLRASLPVFTTGPAPFGLLVLDVDLREQFATLESLLTSDKALYIASENGTLLVHPETRWAAAERPPEDVRLGDLFPQTAPLFEQQTDSIRIEQADGAREASVSAYFSRLDLGQGAEHEGLVLGITSPHEAILGGVRQVRTRSFIITLLFGVSGILFALAFARHLTRPVRRITRAVAGFSRGEWAEELPTDRSDEIGVLATTFLEMAEKIQRQVVELEQKERRQRTVLETAAEGILVTDAEGRIESFNPAAEQILGYRAEEVLGEPAGRYVHPRLEDGVERAGEAGENMEIWAALKPGAEAAGQHKDGGTVPLSVTWSTFELAGQTRLTLFLQDISERKAAEALREQLLSELRHEQESLTRLSESLEERVKERTEDLARTNKTLEQRNRELQDFAYVASHDLQEPLRKIRAFADLLQTDYGSDLPEEGGFYVERMQDAAERMSSLITDLLAFSRVSTRARPFAKVDLNECIRSVLSDLDLQRREVNGEVEVGELPTIEAEETQMRQLLQNLVSNALKFHRDDESPRVVVRGCIDPEETLPSVEGPVCRIEVEDNGIGFEEKYLDRIFSPFQRLHGRSEYEGTGMGLTICRRIVERHEGSITAQSIPGEGTTFVVLLPVEQRQPVESEVVPAEAG